MTSLEKTSSLLRSPTFTSMTFKNSGIAFNFSHLIKKLRTTQSFWNLSGLRRFRLGTSISAPPEKPRSTSAETCGCTQDDPQQCLQRRFVGGQHLHCIGRVLHHIHSVRLGRKLFQLSTRQIGWEECYFTWRTGWLSCTKKLFQIIQIFGNHHQKFFRSQFQLLKSY